MKASLFLFLLFSARCLSSCLQTTPNQLTSCLLNENTYSPNLPFEPSPNHSSVVSVRIYGLVLNTVNEKEQKIDLPMYFITSYQDSRLTWDAEKTGIRHLALNSQLLYRPSAFFSERTYDKINFDESIDSRSLAYIFPNGRVTINMILTDTLKCSFDNFRFPFDEQRCSFRFLIGAAKGEEMSLNDSCRYYVMPRLGLKNISNEHCKEMFRNRLSQVLLREPAGWYMVVHETQSIFESLKIEFADGLIGIVSITLRRQSLLNFMVWIFTPLVMTTISMVSIMFLW